VFWWFSSCRCSRGQYWKTYNVIKVYILIIPYVAYFWNPHYYIYILWSAYVLVNNKISYHIYTIYHDQSRYLSTYYHFFRGTATTTRSYVFRWMSFFPFYIHVASMFECIVDKPKDLLTVKHHRHDRICGRGK
jgi:hypothetical protein